MWTANIIKFGRMWKFEITWFELHTSFQTWFKINVEIRSVISHQMLIIALITEFSWMHKFEKA